MKSRVSVGALVFLVVFLSIDNLGVRLYLPTNLSFGGVETQRESRKETIRGVENVTGINASLWHQRFRSNTANDASPPPRKYIFFKHIRKAGGTFFRSYLDQVRRYHADAEDPMDENKKQLSKDPHMVSFYEQEFSAMDWRCPEVDPRWNHTLSVTILREPISRQLSEFFYSGFRLFVKSNRYTKRERMKGRQLWDLYRSGNHTSEFYTLLDAFLPLWMNRTYDPNWLQRHYTDQFQVRAFSGDHPLSENADMGQFPCFYGGKYGGGASTAGDVNEERLRRAKMALSGFDVVLLMETMNSQAQMVADIVDVPLRNASLASTATVEQQNSSRNTTKSNLVDDIAINAPKAYKLLQDATKYETSLYEHAVSLNQELYNQWMNGRTNAIATGNLICS